jgi:hypothetical protein
METRNISCPCRESKDSSVAQPVITGATGSISKSFRKYLSSIPGNHDIKELQKTAILGTAHILWKVLM